MSQTARRALVTGAASGIGAAIAQRLAASGAVVDCLDIDTEGLELVVSAIASAGGSATAHVVDVSDLASRTAYLDSTARDAPGRDAVLDILVNAAGIVDETDVADFDPERYRQLISVNLDGAVALTLAVLPRLRASAAARILNIASIQGYLGAANSLAYAISKGGLVNATRALAIDLASDGILVNALAPGFIDTPMARLADGTTEYDTEWFRSVYLQHAKLPLGRPGTAEEVAAVAEFFVSPDNGYVTGQILAVDGGVTATF
jgi:NAD(P)-dependent dehydrogenase (short-subunit alcohol dehydrogenase family)